MRRRIAWALLMTLLPALGAGEQARADAEFRELYRGARAQAMGNAFTAVADDEQAIYYNPAGLAGIPGYTLTYASIDVETSSDAITTAVNSASTVKNVSGDTVNKFMGRNIRGHLALTPSLVAPNFGVGVLADAAFGLYPRNQALPQLRLGYQVTNGIQLATGWSVTNPRRRAGGARSGKSDLRVGVAAKMLNRRGGFRDIPLIEAFSVSPDTVFNLASTWGHAYGLDLGLQYLREIAPRTTLSLGAAWTDLGDTYFGDNVDAVKNNLSAGIAARYTLARMRATLSLEQRHLNLDTDWRKRTHIGGEFKMPFLSLYGGLNQMYLTYGLAFDAWLFRVTAVTYAEEIGTYLYQDPERRYLLRFELKIAF